MKKSNKKKVLTVQTEIFTNHFRVKLMKSCCFHALFFEKQECLNRYFEVILLTEENLLQLLKALVDHLLALVDYLHVLVDLLLALVDHLLALIHMISNRDLEVL